MLVPVSAAAVGVPFEAWVGKRAGWWVAGQDGGAPAAAAAQGGMLCCVARCPHSGQLAGRLRMQSGSLKPWPQGRAGRCWASFL